MVRTTVFDVDRMAAAADSPAAAATDLAEWLVAEGTPFREAHAIVGDLVKRSLAGEGALADLVAADDRLGPDAAALTGPGVPVTRRTTRGGAGPGPVADQVDRFRTRLSLDHTRLVAAASRSPASA